MSRIDKITQSEGVRVISLIPQEHIRTLEEDMLSAKENQCQD